MIALKYPRLLAAFQAQPWAILPAKLEEMRAFLAFAASGGKLTAEEVQAATGKSGGSSRAPGRIGLIQVFGSLCQRIGCLEASGGTSYEEISQGLDAFAADPSIKTILLQIDSPGGSCYGLPELCDKIASIKTGGQSIVAIADPLAASAAYWLGCCADKFHCTPSGMVGSIGCLMVHEDISKYQGEVGLKTTLVSAGKYKTEATEYEPLGDEARARMQAVVDDYYAQFVRGVARARDVPASTVRDGFGQGRMLTATEAKREGMIDRLVSFQDLVDDLHHNAGGTSASSLAPTVDMLCRELALE